MRAQHYSEAQSRTHKLTRAQSKSTASRMSSWCPMRETPSSSSSAWLILSSRSPQTPPRSKTHTYCCKQSSRPAIDKHIIKVARKRHIHICSKTYYWDHNLHLQPLDSNQFKWSKRDPNKKKC